MGERFKQNEAEERKKGTKQTENRECGGLRERERDKEMEMKQKEQMRIGQKDRESPLQSDRKSLTAMM